MTTSEMFERLTGAARRLCVLAGRIDQGMDMHLAASELSEIIPGLETSARELRAAAHIPEDEAVD